jgi:predicted MFS family arabinose efflux permease
MKDDRTKAWFALIVLFAVNTLNFYDRQILGAVGETVRDEWKLSDTALGSLGTAFTLLYAVVGVPLGRLADRYSRRWILCAGVAVWSLLTAGSGLARTYNELFVVRLGVGSGEAVCAPASASLIGDLFPASKRAKAMSVFMIGLPIGIALSFLGSSLLEHRYGWRFTFYIAAVPGLICAILVLLIWEPIRGAAEAHKIHASAKRHGSPYLLVLSIPTMWWIIASRALHNFNMYAIGSFLSPFLQRFHHLGKLNAGLISMVVFGLAGVPGLLIGGMLGDRLGKKKANGRLMVAAIATLASAPLMFIGLSMPVGAMVGFVVFAGWAWLRCTPITRRYIRPFRDVIEPSLRGAMALYFFAMYVLEPLWVPSAWDFLSSYFFTRSAARAAGVTETNFQALRPFAAGGLHSALFVVPVFGVLLGLVLFAASRTVANDMEKLQRWMRDSTDREPSTQAGSTEAVVPAAAN